MIELLIVVALATIGIYFTTTTPESMERTHVDDDQYEAGAQEDEGGIGILGIDVGRKMKHVRRARVAARERVAMLRRTATPAETDAVPEAPTAADTDRAIRSVLTGADWGEGGESTAPMNADVYEGDDDDDRLTPILPRTARVSQEPAQAEAGWDETPEIAEAEDEADDFDELDMPAGEPLCHEPEADAVTAPVAAGDAPEDEDSAFNAAISAAIRAELAEQDSYRDAARTAPEPARTQDLSGPPVIEDFDPDEDQIVIGYHPEEAGDGRIGITEDPAWPGTARVTLGGKVVALVPGGYGLVQAYHIELRLRDDAA
ncbi:hypothetical protein [Pseudooceanicola sp.]|uniref:hypothetical protein n=1 Tax=Pseudooceanicola sp. TaxID=1914328 RepID=UPI004057FA69